MIDNLQDALARINELEAQVTKLEEEIEELKNHRPSGRKKHDDKWMASYEAFAVKFESGMTIMEIVNEGEISRRTAYRYKTYYDSLKKIADK